MTTTTRKRLTALAVAAPLLAGITSALAAPAHAAASPIGTKVTAPTYISEDGLVLGTATCRAFTKAPAVRQVRSLTCTVQKWNPSTETWDGIVSPNVFRPAGVRQITLTTPQFQASCTGVYKTVLTAGLVGGSYKVGLSERSTPLSLPGCNQFPAGGAADQSNGNSWTSAPAVAAGHAQG